MVGTCAVRGCTRLNKRHKLHRFPRDPERFQIWAKACGRMDLNPEKRNYVICDLHFSEAHKFKEHHNRTNLKFDAFPDVYLPPLKGVPGEKNSEDVSVGSNKDSEKQPTTLENEEIQNTTSEEQPIIIENDVIEQTVFEEQPIIIEYEEIEKTASEEINCRTCLKSVSLNETAMFTDFQIDMLSKCIIPQIEIIETDRICVECSNNLETSYQFITQCQDVENRLKKEKEDRKIESEIVELNEISPLEDANDELVQSECTVDPEIIQYKLKLIRASFPKLNIIVPATQQDSHYNFKVTTKPVGFSLKRYLNRIISLSDVKDFPLPETRFDLSSSPNAKKRVLLLGTSAKTVTSCTECYKEFSRPSHLEFHLRKGCMNNILKCHICNERFFDKLKLQVHKRHHKNHRCATCKKQFSNDEELATHKNECDGGFYCCGQKFEVKNTYMRHRYREHSTSKQYLCDTCGKSFANSPNLNAHKKTHTAPVICPICKKVFKNKCTYVVHDRFVHHQPRRRFMCEHCGRVLLNKSGLKKHLEMHNENRTKNFRCDICQQQFYHKTALRLHIRLKHSYQDFKYSCDMCDEKFSRGDYLKRHKRQHVNPNFTRDSTSERVFDAELQRYKYVRKLGNTCPICKKEIKSRSNLYTHMKIHGYRSRHHKCNYCELTFFSKANCIRHEKTHLSAVLRCRICHVRKFDNREDLELHENTHIKKYACEHCDQKFGRKYLLDVHVSAEHMESGDNGEASEMVSIQNVELSIDFEEQILESQQLQDFQ